MAKWERTELVKISEAEFNLLAEQMRTSTASKATHAAYLVLVEGMLQAAACAATGASASNCHDTVKRIIKRHKRIVEVYAARFAPEAQETVNGTELPKDRGNDKGEDKATETS